MGPVTGFIAQNGPRQTTDAADVTKARRQVSGQAGGWVDASSHRGPVDSPRMAPRQSADGLLCSTTVKTRDSTHDPPRRSITCRDEASTHAGTGERTAVNPREFTAFRMARRAARLCRSPAVLVRGRPHETRNPRCAQLSLNLSSRRRRDRHAGPWPALSCSRRPRGRHTCRPCAGRPDHEAQLPRLRQGRGGELRGVQVNWPDDGRSCPAAAKPMYAELFNRPCQQHDAGDRNFGTKSRGPALQPDEKRATGSAAGSSTRCGACATGISSPSDSLGGTRRCAATRRQRRGERCGTAASPRSTPHLRAATRGTVGDRHPAPSACGRYPATARRGRG